MSFFRNKNRWYTILYSRITLGILLVLCVLMSISVYERYKSERDMMSRRVITNEELEMLRERKSDLEEKVKYINDERGVEEEIRKYFDVVKEGEQVVILLDDDKQDIEIPEDSLKTTDVKEAFWTRFFSW